MANRHDSMWSLRKEKQMKEALDCPDFLPGGRSRPWFRERNPRRSILILLNENLEIGVQARS